jgi:nuclear GTP-binding protein
MYRGGNPIRNKKGRIVHGGSYNDKNSTGGKLVKKMGSAVARTAPNRRWFGNTRVVNPEQLDKFREEMGAKLNDPYTVVLRTRKLPMGLLKDAKKTQQMNLLSTESFESVFGPKSQRKRPKVAVSGMAELLKNAQAKAEEYNNESNTTDRDIVKEDDGTRTLVRDAVFDKGQSKRIWGELYKVLDCSDIVVQVLDVRDPLGTRSKNVENHLRKNARHKHLIFVLNKCDLVPVWVTRRWVSLLSKEYPTLAFHASINNPYGKGSLINLLRQFAMLHKDKKQISVGFIGYPNVGKSSVINTLKKKRVCKAAPIPGETKIWQYITLMKRVFLIDCPGVVPPSKEEEAVLVLRGVTRSERLQYPEHFIPPILAQVKREYIVRTYGVHGWDSSVDFVEQIARKSGRLLKGGECDIKSVSKQIINDWQRGKLPWFKPPPASEQDPVAQGTSEAAPAESAETTIPNTDAEKDVVLPLPKLVQNLKNLEQKLPRFNSNKLDRSADDGALQGGKDVKKQDSDDEDEWDDLEM